MRPFGQAMVEWPLYGRSAGRVSVRTTSFRVNHRRRDTVVGPWSHIFGAVCTRTPATSGDS